MKLLNKLERKYGKYAIHNLTLYLIIGYVIGYVLEMINSDWYFALSLDPYLILKGQVWRLVTWVIAPPSSLSIFTIIMLFFYYSIGTTLENTWGAFKYNVYLFSGLFFTIVAVFIIYFAFPFSTFATELAGISEAEFLEMAKAYSKTIAEVKGAIISQYVSTYYINMSIFLLFATLFPEMQVMLYFVIPVKIKWLAYLYVLLMIYDMYYFGWIGRIVVIVSLFNFLLFFIMIKKSKGLSLKERKRKADYHKKVYTAKAMYEGGARHKCAICGRTELDDPNLTFRYCSKCSGSKEYCNDHLFSHEHV